ncbi:hypothetical protein HNP49_002177 [Pseudomonas fluvialis]|uniref:PA1123-like domain-containing protein n=1 Tax=Pseudomonas fluvialis TaxID=1793966 RepID=A0A7X0BSE5_9PSED|nr:DUF2025 family protein [Pseudomonas fluvialis]MBB6342009.1 hypothetical protein [Pseudomonas fluvialis]
MSITSATICAAADQLQGLVGYNAKTGQYIVRFSEDSFGKDVPDDRIVPACEFVWKPLLGNLMTLSRERLQLLIEQNVDDRLQISEPLRLYLRRQDLPEIKAERYLRQPA